MSTNQTFLAIFTGSKTSPRRAAWDALSEAERNAKQEQGRAAWGAWMQKHQASVNSLGGPLGKTKKVSARGIEDVTNYMAAMVIVEAESHDAAARLFENHPHFSIFPGDAVEIMPVKAIPGA
ncbi:MAG: hypothetical protein WDM77_05410 [Steroidobacteraceae bacterium]